ncbi:unnamed protein product [Nesidiocoris tenuis]|uniref:Uncharacterized protein n=1 Tax=Nesidiocoris tenuis TaxID=355587 RepID=A0A6H5H5S8_9HEMI|nr:unnamed protein product [Nesidiocoris tenuis]
MTTLDFTGVRLNRYAMVCKAQKTITGNYSRNKTGGSDQLDTRLGCLSVLARQMMPVTFPATTSQCLQERQSNEIRTASRSDPCAVTLTAGGTLARGGGARYSASAAASSQTRLTPQTRDEGSAI